jgi:hypothetical protein
MSAALDRSSGQRLRTAAIGGLAFTVLYITHRVLQGTGPDGSTAQAVAAYNLSHRSTLLASEIAVGLALLALIPFLATLVPVIWRAGQETLAVAVGISGGVFVAMGFVSNAAETALIGVADSNQPAAVLALNQLQGRIPIVWTITALVAVISLAIHRTGLVWRWLGVVGLVAAAIFLLGSVFSVLGSTPREPLPSSGLASSSSGCSCSAPACGVPHQRTQPHAHSSLGAADWPASHGARRCEQRAAGHEPAAGVRPNRTSGIASLDRFGNNLVRALKRCCGVP